MSWDEKQMGGEWMVELGGDPSAWSNRFSALANLSEMTLTGPGQPGSENAMPRNEDGSCASLSLGIVTPTPQGRAALGATATPTASSEHLQPPAPLFTTTPTTNLARGDDSHTRKRQRVVSPAQEELHKATVRGGPRATTPPPPEDPLPTLQGRGVQDQVADVAHSIVDLAAARLARIIQDAMVETEELEGRDLGGARTFLEAVTERLRKTEATTRRTTTGDAAGGPRTSQKTSGMIVRRQTPYPATPSASTKRPHTTMDGTTLPWTRWTMPRQGERTGGGAAAVAAGATDAPSHQRTTVNLRDPRILRRLEAEEARGRSGTQQQQQPTLQQAAKTTTSSAVHHAAQVYASAQANTDAHASARLTDIKQPAPIRWSQTPAMTRQWVARQTPSNAPPSAESWNAPTQVAAPYATSMAPPAQPSSSQQQMRATAPALSGNSVRGEPPMVHATTPADRARHTLTTEYDEWKKEKEAFGTACTAEIFGRIGLDVESICEASALLSGVVAAYTGVQDFKLGQPRDPPYPVNPRNLPSTWFLSKLPTWAVRTLVKDVGAVSTQDVSVIFHDHAEEIPTLLASVTGFHQLNDGVAEMRIREILAEEVTFEGIAELAAANKEFEGADKYAVANQLVQELYVRCRRVDEEVVGSLIVAHIYMKSPTDNADWWMTWRHSLIERAFRGPLYEMGPDIRCDGCHGMDHNAQQCPFTRKLGWHVASAAPQKIAGARPGPSSPAAWGGGRGRGSAYAAHDATAGYGQLRPKRKPTNAHKPLRGARMGGERGGDFKGKYAPR
ncbi:hypothetical protein PYCCODRAFT_1467033 [Trametes coccinea BRFM310]|uniref:Uncharacterized protein n=1 Tax=Trametes coccinea (strain BRFM310) TaxID=1353009 RepID=A0A1Y2ISH7_TRAC3|nr:hypothetical protein PYCCODRAFT_1467033 [Trametes coccinea BRFM310]